MFFITNYRGWCNQAHRPTGKLQLQFFIDTIFEKIWSIRDKHKLRQQIKLAKASDK